MKGLYDIFPRRYGKSRKIIYSKKELLELVNRDNGFTDVFISVFAYDNLKETDTGYKIDSESAILDKIFLDMDFKDFALRSKNFVEEFEDDLFVDPEEIRENLNKKESDILDKLIYNLKNGIQLEEKQENIYDKLFFRKYLPFAENFLFRKVKKLEMILRKKKILRVWNFSGGGFHLYVYISNKPKNKKYFYRNCADKLSKMVMIREYEKDGEIIYDNEHYFDRYNNRRDIRIYDPHCPPKLSQMARIIGTFNPRRKLFCTSLTEEDFDLGLEHIKEKANKQNTKINYLGTKLLTFDDSCDSNNVLDNFSVVYEIDLEEVPKNIKDLLCEYGILWDEIPPCMKYFLNKENQNLVYEERFLLITFLYRCGLDKKDIIEVLKLILSPQKLFHCCGFIKNGYLPTTTEKARVEVQIETIIDNDYWISCNKIREFGICHQLCTFSEPLEYF